MKKRCKNRKSILYFTFQILIFLLLILTFSLLWAQKNYGSIGMDEILFTLNMPLKGTSDSLYISYINSSVIPTLLIWIGELVITWPRDKKTYLSFLYKDPNTEKRAKLIKISIFPLEVNGKIAFLCVLVWICSLIFGAEKSFGLIDL